MKDNLPGREIRMAVSDEKLDLRSDDCPGVRVLPQDFLFIYFFYIYLLLFFFLRMFSLTWMTLNC